MDEELTEACFSKDNLVDSDSDAKESDEQDIDQNDEKEALRKAKVCKFNVCHYNLFDYLLLVLIGCNILTLGTLIKVFPYFT